ncbi:ROK family protein [Streptomyces radicis]|uniref:ROK family protein n=1 Tax=Streptomyces radicis TaxID=1750517 RepID=A0A3A9WDB4_9ACTN|nr:ROK family protein [Streptomyces radicis]RKN07374.1 ROK family protein [Streptomyces radicis]RKN19607.1 ROK family protein [Streptomyces radicis]
MNAPTGRLGIDIGGTKVALRAVADGARGRGNDRADAWEDAWEDVFRWPETGDADRDLAALAERVRALRDRWDAPVASVGVAMPGTVDPAGRVVTWPGRPSWTGLDFGASLRALFPAARVAWADDGDLAALAEAHATGCANLVYLGVGTGIGGGIVLGGRPCPGLGRGSSEIGHLIVDRAGPRCGCGRRGCLQAVAAGPATLRRAARLRGTGGEVPFAALREAFAARAPWAVAAVDESCAALGAAIVSLGELLAPDRALVGGGFADGLPGFVAAVADHARGLARPGHPPPPVGPAVLGGLSSLHGAVLLAEDPGPAGPGPA